MQFPSEVEVIQASRDVLLDIAYSPVVLESHVDGSGIVPLPREVRKTEGGYIVILNPRKPAESAQAIDEVMLAIARARYLVYKAALHRQFPALGYNQKCEVAGRFFDGAVPFSDGPHHRLIHRLGR